jgi:hypothetical protein
VVSWARSPSSSRPPSNCASARCRSCERNDQDWHSGRTL